MAIGLTPLGRGKLRQLAELGALHVLGAAVAGGLVGGLFGAVGELLGLATWRPWLIGAAVVVALGLTLWRPIPLGPQRQVPREWGRTMLPRRRFFLWGALLGSGLATSMYHSAFLVLVAAQLGAGVGLATAAGAVFGVAREVLAVVPPLRGLDLYETTELLPRLSPVVRRLNALVVVVGGLLLVLTSWG